MHRFKSHTVNKNNYILLFLLCIVSTLKTHAQLGFCTENSGDPIFLNSKWNTLFFNAHRPFEK